MKMRNADLYELYDEVAYALRERTDFESRVTVAVSRALYRTFRAFHLGAIRRAVRRGL